DASDADFEIREANVPPVIAAIGPKTVNEGQAIAFTASATDANLHAQTLTYSLGSGAPAGAAIQPATGVFSWTPTEAQGPGDYPISVRVSDGTASVDSAVAIHVNDVTSAPVLAGVPASATIPELAAYSFTATATDSDLPTQTLTFSLVGAAPGAAIGASTGIF